MKIDHTAIWVVDLEKEKEFFLKYFDCTVNGKYMNHAKHFSSYFITFAGGGRVEIMNRENIKFKEKNESPGYAHIAVKTDSREEVDRLTNMLRKDGIVVDSGPRLTGDGYYESVILDPENNKIEIVSD
jgi:lactoylglutathione lyase